MSLNEKKQGKQISWYAQKEYPKNEMDEFKKDFSAFRKIVDGKKTEDEIDYIRSKGIWGKEGIIAGYEQMYADFVGKKAVLDKEEEKLLFLKRKGILPPDNYFNYF